MAKKSRRNRKKNPKQFKINQENAIKKMKHAAHCGQQQQRRTNGHMLVNMSSKRMCHQAKSALSRQLNTLSLQHIHRDSCGVVPDHTLRVVHLG